MILTNILNELKGIRLALEKLANIEAKLPDPPKDLNFSTLGIEEEDKGDKIFQKQLEAASNKGFMFPEDAIPLDELERRS